MERVAPEGSEFVERSQASDIVISTYGLVRRDLQDLALVRWDNIILDEAQNIKNPLTKQARAARRLKGDYRIALTGTPVENRLSELWSIMSFLNPGYLGSLESFRRTLALPIERYQDQGAAERLRKLVRPFILRRLKTDPRVIQDLPEKIEYKVFCNLTREQATLYEAVVRDAMDKLKGIEGQERSMQRRGTVLAMLTRLKQVCDHPALYLGDRSETSHRSGKLNRLCEMLEETWRWAIACSSSLSSLRWATCFSVTCRIPSDRRCSSSTAAPHRSDATACLSAFRTIPMHRRFSCFL